MDLFALARNPVPSGAFVGTFPGHDGQPLRFARFKATQGQRRGTACLFTGHAESIEKYFEMIADLRRRGFAVAIMDWRGQGGSYRAVTTDQRAHIESYAEHEADLAAFMREVVLPDCPPPYVAVAHSMGGHILLRTAAKPGSWFERLVLSAPMIELTRAAMGFPAPLVRAFSEVACLAGLGRQPAPGAIDWRDGRIGFENNRLTTDRERYSRNRAIIEGAPHLTVGVPTIAWLRATMRSIAVVSDPAFAAKVAVPALFFIAGKDVIVEPSAIEDFSSRMKSGTHVILANAKHEVLQENDEIRGRFWAAFDAYLDIGQKV
jgi:lysophospholipase